MAAIVVLATAGSAFANFGPHGGYALDTDACAGCHRAHTSFSDLSWTATTSGGATTNHSALLVSSASTMQEFCYACHGDNAPGASTNVQVGVFDAGPSGADGVTGPGVAYQTNSTYYGALNGGGFQSMPATNGVGFTATSSMHDMEKGSATDPMWGAGSSAPIGVNLTCTSCHDPHGSSNYRILKDSVNGVTVGGYNGETPQPFVFSSEEGYPAGGWLKHLPGASQMTTYFPNYTTAEYKWANTDLGYAPDDFRSISTWCSACHQEYNNRAPSTYNYGGYEAVDATRVAGTLTPGVGTAVGDRVRHRHKVDISIDSVTQGNGWGSTAIISSVLPLEKRPGNWPAERGTWQTNDYMGCLTCHRAHGAQTVMTGWAVSSLANNPSAVVTWYPTMATAVGPSGVNPNFSSSLLRADNRGVCERCHNK